jgi:glycosyltransferase involved in cell wall biosynthesis
VKPDTGWRGWQGHPDERLAVLVPALDEEESLPGLLEALPEEALVLVVDNGSTDRTPEVAREGGAVVVRELRRGYGAACLAGLSALAERLERSSVLVFADADQAVDPETLETLVRPILEGRADLVLGARVDPGGGVGTLLPHARLGNHLILSLTHLLFGRRFRDLGPFRAVRFGDLLDLEMDDRDWGWTLQMQLRAVLRGLEVVEVDVPHRSRSAGRSKISGSPITSLRVGLKMLYTLARERVRG